ncbi:MAG: hypothetical protein V4726_03125 [Verrucomicrobiota bacterium]
MKPLSSRFPSLLPLVLAAATAAATSSRSLAQVQTGGPWKLSAFTIDSGGGKSSAGAWTITGTLGQPDASPITATAGAFVVQGGFWADAAVIPAAGDGPGLTLTRLDAFNVQLAWPAEAAGYTLQYSNDLTNWAFLQDITAAGSAAWSLNQGPRFFFRLKKP